MAAKLEDIALTETPVIIDSIVAKTTPAAKKVEGAVTVAITPKLHCKLSFIDKENKRIRASVKLVVECKTEANVEIIKFEYSAHTDYLSKDSVEKTEIKSKDSCYKLCFPVYQRIADRSVVILEDMGLGKLTLPLSRVPQEFVQIK